MKKLKATLWNFISDEKKVAAVLVLLFVLQIVPILYLGQFNHPTSDDFLYGKAAHDTLVSTGYTGCAGSNQWCERRLL